jgi:hypothetical protein
MDIAERIREHIFADDAEEQLKHYMAPGAFSGAAFERIGGRGDDPETMNEFTPADLVAVTTLNVRVSGWGAIELLETRRDEFAGLLAAVPRVPLHEVSKSDLEPLWDLQRALDSVRDVGHVTRSKLLARKRPRLVPIRDHYVLASLVGQAHGELTLPLREALQHEGIVDRLEDLRTRAGAHDISTIRVLDILVWMRTYGAESVQ